MRSFSILTGILLATVAASPADRADPGPALWEALQQAPAALAPNPARLSALRELDKWLSEADSEENPAVVAYYQHAMDHVLEMLEKETVSEGVRVFQLYSSSVLVQTPDTVFALDLDQGPNKSLEKTPEEEGIPFRMTDEQIARFAQAVDISFHTHEHYDHTDFELVKALAEAGKTIVVTESHRAVWAAQPWSGQLLVLDETLDRPHPLRGLKVDVLHDFQWNNMEHTSGTPCNAWLITTPQGVSVCDKGDINCGVRFNEWLQQLVARGRHVDLMVGTPFYWKGEDRIQQIDTLLKPVWCIGHVWEFTHRSKGEAGPATGNYAMNLFLVQRKTKEGHAMALSWGEAFTFTKPAD